MECCKNCGKQFTGKFCSFCGQKKYTDKDKSLAHIVEEALHFLTHFEGSFFTSIKAILLHPGKLTADYCAGIRKKYYRPISLFLMVVIIYLLNPMYSGLNQEFRHFKDNSVYGPMAKATIEKKISNSTITEADLAIEYGQKSKSLSKVLLFIFILSSSVFLYVLYFKQRKWLFDHVILATEINTIFILLIFILFPLMMLLIRVLFRINEDVVSDEIYALLSFIAFFTYNSIAFKSMFKESTIKTVIKSLVFTLLHTLFFIFVYRFIVFKVTLWFI
ncbi:DUF3667 domain-containing protein [Sediminibacterium sp.]|uniref:DUF3667 domain-containing protein n=1 Tax=Sediminibacterium sp. TaxID=1917865 RepID=UPI0025CC194B|nr:DUF3667 domain-containing protein [Sediminibacterium sp.]